LGGHRGAFDGHEFLIETCAARIAVRIVVDNKQGVTPCSESRPYALPTLTSNRSSMTAPIPSSAIELPQRHSLANVAHKKVRHDLQ
jgi:hypothetical protein